MPYRWLPQHKAPHPPPYVIAVTYFMAFDNTFQRLSFRARNIRHTKLRGLGYKSGYTKPRVSILAPGTLHVPKHVPTINQ